MKKRNFLVQEKVKEDVQSTDIQEVKTYSVKYRTEQTSITRIEEDAKSYSLLKKEFDVSINFTERTVRVDLLDTYNEFSPPTLTEVYELVSETDRIRNGVNFKYNKDGKLSEITNREEIYSAWLDFKENKINDLIFIKTLKRNNKAQYQNVLAQGDGQFDVNNNDVYNDYKQDLFYRILFDRYLTNKLSEIPNAIEDFKSGLFPDVIFPINVRYDVVDDEDDVIVIRKIGEADISEETMKNIESKYEELHQPVIHFKFSEYRLIYRVRYRIDKKTNIILDAELTLVEEVINNIQSTVKYLIRKV